MRLWAILRRENVVFACRFLAAHIGNQAPSARQSSVRLKVMPLVFAREMPVKRLQYVLRPTLSASVVFSRYSQRPRNITHREPSGVQNSSFNISQTVAIC